MNYSIPTVQSYFHFLNPDFKALIHPNPTQKFFLPPNYSNPKPLLFSHSNKFPNINVAAKKRNLRITASIESNNGETANWVSWLPTGGLAADKILRSISSATSSPIGQFISSPTTFLHSVDPRIKLVWLLALVVLPARAHIVVRFGLVACTALLGSCVTYFGIAGLGTDGAPQLLQPRTPSFSISGLPDLPTSLSGYSYLIMKLGPLQLTRKGLSVASTASCLTFIIFQSASLCLATTTPEQLAFALRWFMLPLRRIGVPVAEIVLTLMLSLRFINLVFDEVRNVALGIVSRRINWQQLTTMETIDVFASYIRRIFKNIFSHAQQVSQAMIVRGFRGDSNAHKLYFLSNSSSGMANFISLLCLVGVTSAALLSDYFLV
ncbi:ABC/ECF transporter, transmembrane component [Corchorus olitorius]|uniref:ABC/ECF transporter, transmembrane component n=1 Tax=Corchorus olitorius TaxID=93759 RepID=A0A1R3IS97_9ROSI|nr:ABC/ECF transporter, transmembrane component [Corchorus olitorius]